MPQKTQPRQQNAMHVYFEIVAQQSLKNCLKQRYHIEVSDMVFQQLSLRKYSTRDRKLPLGSSPSDHVLASTSSSRNIPSDRVHNNDGINKDDDSSDDDSVLGMSLASLVPTKLQRVEAACNGSGRTHKDLQNGNTRRKRKRSPSLTQQQLEICDSRASGSLYMTSKNTTRRARVPIDNGRGNASKRSNKEKRDQVGPNKVKVQAETAISKVNRHVRDECKDESNKSRKLLKLLEPSCTIHHNDEGEETRLSSIANHSPKKKYQQQRLCVEKSHFPESAGEAMTHNVLWHLWHRSVHGSPATIQTRLVSRRIPSPYGGSWSNCPSSQIAVKRTTTSFVSPEVHLSQSDNGSCERPFDNGCRIRGGFQGGDSLYVEKSRTKASIPDTNAVVSGDALVFPLPHQQPDLKERQDVFVAPTFSFWSIISTKNREGREQNTTATQGMTRMEERVATSVAATGGSEADGRKISLLDDNTCGIASTTFNTSDSGGKKQTVALPSGDPKKYWRIPTWVQLEWPSTVASNSTSTSFSPSSKVMTKLAWDALGVLLAAASTLATSSSSGASSVSRRQLYTLYIFDFDLVRAADLQGRNEQQREASQRHRLMKQRQKMKAQQAAQNITADMKTEEEKVAETPQYEVSTTSLLQCKKEDSFDNNVSIVERQQRQGGQSGQERRPRRRKQKPQAMYSVPPVLSFVIPDAVASLQWNPFSCITNEDGDLNPMDQLAVGFRYSGIVHVYQVDKVSAWVAKNEERRRLMQQGRLTPSNASVQSPFPSKSTYVVLSDPRNSSSGRGHQQQYSGNNHVTTLLFVDAFTLLVAVGSAVCCWRLPRNGKRNDDNNDKIDDKVQKNRKRKNSRVSSSATLLWRYHPPAPVSSMTQLSPRKPTTEATSHSSSSCSAVSSGSYSGLVLLGTERGQLCLLNWKETVVKGSFTSERQPKLLYEWTPTNTVKRRLSTNNGSHRLDIIRRRHLRNLPNSGTHAKIMNLSVSTTNGTAAPFSSMVMSHVDAGQETALSNDERINVNPLRRRDEKQRRLIFGAYQVSWVTSSGWFLSTQLLDPIDFLMNRKSKHCSSNNVSTRPLALPQIWHVPPVVRIRSSSGRWITNDSNSHKKSMEWSTPIQPVEVDATPCNLWCWTKVPAVTKQLPHHNKYVLDSEPRIIRSADRGLWMWLPQADKDDGVLSGSGTAAIRSLAGVNQRNVRNETDGNVATKQKTVELESSYMEEDDGRENESDDREDNDDLLLQAVPHSIPLPFATTPQAIAIHPSKEWIVLGVDQRLVLLVGRKIL